MTYPRIRLLPTVALLGIVGLIIAFVLRSQEARRDTQQAVQQTAIAAEWFRLCVDIFVEDSGRLPQDAEAARFGLLDGWGKSFHYEIIDDSNRRIKLTSAGIDAQMGTSDDLEFEFQIQKPQRSNHSPERLW